MDFKDYCSQNFSQNSQDYIKTDQFTQNAEQIIDKYSNFSNDELLSELIKQTNQKKQNGSLDNQKLDQIYTTLSSILPQENKQNLDEIFRRLK